MACFRQLLLVLLAHVLKAAAECPVYCPYIGGKWRIACTRPACQGCPQCPHTGPTPPPHDYVATRRLTPGQCIWHNPGKHICDRTIRVDHTSVPKVGRWVRTFAITKHFSFCDQFSGDEARCTDAYYLHTNETGETRRHQCNYGGVYGPTICKGKFMHYTDCPAGGTPAPPLPPPNNLDEVQSLRYGIDYPTRCHAIIRGGSACQRSDARANRRNHGCWNHNGKEKECLDSYVIATTDPKYKHFLHYSDVPARFPCIYVGKALDRFPMCIADFEAKTTCGPTTPTLAPTPAPTPTPPTSTTSTVNQGPQLLWITMYSTGSFGKVQKSKIEFNRLFRQARLGIARRECAFCTGTHKDIYFRRKMKLHLYDAWEGLVVTWSDDNFHDDFDIYSSLEDAIADRNAWQYCNGNDQHIGFPRDCGPSSRAHRQWTSLTRGGQTDYKWSMQIAAITSFTTTTSSVSVAEESIQSGDVVFLSTMSGKGNMIDVEGIAVHSRWFSRGNWQAITIEKAEGGRVNSGDVVYLKTHTQAHIDVVGEMVRARWNDQGGWQAMVIGKRTGSGPIDSGDVVCFLSVHTNKHIAVEDGSVRARWNDCGDWQAMRIEKEDTRAIFSGSLVHLLAHTANRMEVDGTSVSARWSEAGVWQTFTIENYGGRAIWPDDAVFLKAHTGRLVHVEDTKVLAKWKGYGAWQKLSIEKMGDHGPVMPGDSICLRAHTHKYIGVNGVAVQASWSECGQFQSFIVEASETKPEFAPDHRRLSEASPLRWRNEQQGNSSVVFV